MSLPAAGSQAVRWTLRSFGSVVIRPAPRGRHVLRPLQPVPRRFLCSPSVQGSKPPQRSHDNPQAELSLRSLLDMGFTETQAEQVYDAVSKKRGKSGAEPALSALKSLFLLGLNPSTALKALEKCPDLYHVDESQFNQRLANLRKLGFVEGGLQRVVSFYPQILTIPVKRTKRAVMFLREKCQFTVQQVTDILRESPAVVQDDLGQLEYKFQYVYFRMGLKQSEMVKAKLFRFSLDEVRCRHCFLERRGLYETPDKKGQTLIQNPKLSHILHLDQDTYLTNVAKATVEEYVTFQKMMAREWREEELERDMESVSDDEDEEDDYEDEEKGFESRYTRTRKK